jgi:hypothetical protein
LRLFCAIQTCAFLVHHDQGAIANAVVVPPVPRLAIQHGAAQRGEGSGCRPEAPVDFDPLQAIRQQGVEVGDPRQRIGNRQAIQRHESLPAGSPQVKDSETVRAALGDGDTRLAAQDFVDGAFVGDGQAGFVVDIGMPAGRGEIRDFSGRRLDDYRGQGSGFERIGRD